jgi:methylated-DNA-[protein]-cysteine S-methyltransferase
MSENPLEAAVLPTLVGPLTVVADDGVVVASSFDSLDETIAKLPVHLAVRPVEHVDDLGAISKAVAAYNDGDVHALDGVPVRQEGGDGKQRMWKALREVPAGETVSYAELAELAGSPRGARLAGNACATNQVAPFVPCHRVVRSDGTLGGYYWGLTMKQALLEHEGASAQLRL